MNTAVLILCGLFLSISPAWAQRSCADQATGNYACLDGSYGNTVGDNLFLTRPREIDQPALEAKSCYRDSDNQLICEP
jgi:hypothetical protein